MDPCSSFLTGFDLQKNRSGFYSLFYIFCFSMDRLLYCTVLYSNMNRQNNLKVFWQHFFVQFKYKKANMKYRVDSGFGKKFRIRPKKTDLYLIRLRKTGNKCALQLQKNPDKLASLDPRRGDHLQKQAGGIHQFFCKEYVTI